MRNTHCYITAAGRYLPGAPVTNERMIDYIGAIDDRSQRLGRMVLRQNRIATRHYAIKPDGTTCHTNAGMAARAANAALGRAEVARGEVDFLAAATTQGDALVPGHASAVHAEMGAEMGIGALEVASFQSVCASSMMAVRMASLMVGAGERQAAVVTGSEFSSRWFQPGFYHDAAPVLADDATRMSAEFLRWTLSDGAGALVMEPTPNEHGPSLRVDWMSLVSLADRFEPCMYAGRAPASAEVPGQPWSHYASPADAARDGAVMLLQDFALLKRMMRAWVGEYLRAVDDGHIEPDAIDWKLCHYSAHSLREELVRLLSATDAMVPEERWFSNLATKGNTGAAALFIMIEELFYSGALEAGQRILCVVPESGRGIVSFMLLTVV